MADALDELCTGCLAQGVGDLAQTRPTGPGHLDLEQLVMPQGALEFRENAVRDTGGADRDDGLEGMRPSPEFTPVPAFPYHRVVIRLRPQGRGLL